MNDEADDIILPDDDILTDPERLLDEAIELTFPASDPVAVEHAFVSASARERDRAAKSQS